MNEPCCRSIWAMATRHDWCMEIGIEIEVETDAMTIYSSLYLSQCSRSRYYYLLLSYRLDQTIALYCADERTRARSRHWIDWLPFGAVRPAVNHMMLHCSLDARYLTLNWMHSSSWIVWPRYWPTPFAMKRIRMNQQSTKATESMSASGFRSQFSTQSTKLIEKKMKRMRSSTISI